MCMVNEYIHGINNVPLFLQGDAIDVLRSIESNSIDYCITLPCRNILMNRIPCNTYDF